MHVVEDIPKEAQILLPSDKIGFLSLNTGSLRAKLFYLLFLSVRNFMNTGILIFDVWVNIRLRKISSRVIVSLIFLVLKDFFSIAGIIMICKDTFFMNSIEGLKIKYAYLLDIL